MPIPCCVSRQYRAAVIAVTKAEIKLHQALAATYERQLAKIESVSASSAPAAQPTPVAQPTPTPVAQATPTPAAPAPADDDDDDEQPPGPIGAVGQASGDAPPPYDG